MNGWQYQRIIELVEAIMARKTFDKKTIVDLGYIKLYAQDLADRLQSEIELQAGEDL